MIPASQASKLLDRVLVGRLMSLIDFDELAAFEADLFCALRACGAEAHEASATSRKMITAAFQRLGEELQLRPNDASPFDDCALCELELAQAKRSVPSG